MPTSTQAFRFTSLPAEIRNQIMEYALVPGDIYPYPTDPNPKPPTPSRKLLHALFKTRAAAASQEPQRLPPTRQPSSPLLKTCTQSYRDGRHIFYTQNTFHLPAGPAPAASAWLASLPPHHGALIRRAACTLGLADLTPPCLAEMHDRWLWDLPLKTRRLERRVAFEISYCLCWRYWADKLRWLRGWEGLERVEVRAAGTVWAFDGDGFRGLGKEDEREILETARVGVEGELRGLVDEVGWKAARRLLMAKAAAAGGMI